MTKKELIEFMAAESGIPKVKASEVLKTFTSAVMSELKKKEGRLTLVDFGTFYTIHQKARKGRHPQTGETIKIKAKNVVRFKAGKKLRESI